MRTFFDTNVVFCMYDERAAGKQQIARRLFREQVTAGVGVISVQVVAEFIHAASRKLRPALGAAQLSTAVDALLPACRIDTSKGLLIAALGLAQRHRLPICDAMIVQAAIDAGATVLYSEDLHAGQQFSGVTVVNPFTAPAPEVQQPKPAYRAAPRPLRKAPARRR